MRDSTAAYPPTKHGANYPEPRGKGRSLTDPSIVINAARVGSAGGLLSFATALISCFDNCNADVTLVSNRCDMGIPIKQVAVPSWLGSSSRVSAVRPLLWWLYSAMFFPRRKHGMVLATTHHVLPFCKHQIVTVHDLRPFYLPDNWAQRFYWRQILPRALKKCDGVLTVSETSKHQITSVFGIRSDKVYVVPNSIDLEFFRPGSSEQNSTESFLLVVGASWEHKNTLELLRMHPLWANKYTLRVVAGRGQYRDRLLREVNQLGISERVKLLSDVPREQLLDLYQQCAALVYPSVMEGFGLPPLEAMACGRPVIVSDVPVFRELFGEVPFYVKLGDVNSWELAFRSLERDGDRRCAVGIQHAQSFSHQRMRDALASALLEVWGIDIR